MLNAERVVDLTHELYLEAIPAGAKQVRVEVLMHDGSRVFFVCDEKWAIRDGASRPDGSVVIGDGVRT